MEERFQVGVITTPHGVQGEVKVFPTTDDPRRFKRLKEVILDTGKGERTLEIEHVKFFKQFVIIKFKEFHTPEEVAVYRQKSLYVTRENAVRLGKDEYFIADLMGLRILNEDNQEIGVLREVLETGANDVYIIDLKDGRELLLPAIKECVLRVDIEAGEMQIHILDGLLDEM
ncbi:MAG: 16S rRNA processing protein RimM [Lachnospiraceae bacterium]|nr:16S rRNA processing protein RimM [Lachnospiraceae bacterium]